MRIREVRRDARLRLVLCARSTAPRRRSPAYARSVVGHGPPAAPAVLAEQRRYLLMARETIARAADGRPQLGQDEANRVAALMERYLRALRSAGSSARARRRSPPELAREAAPA